MCVIKATWEVCIHTIKVLVEVAFLVAYPDVKSLTSMRIAAHLPEGFRQRQYFIAENEALRYVETGSYTDCSQTPVHHFDHVWRSNCWDISDSPPICKAVIDLQ